MKIGIVCPYSLDRPGGVQLHITDLAEALIDLGHEVSVLAPAAPNTVVPGYVKSAGRSVPIAYNGSTARLTFGLGSAKKVRKWLKDGDFDVVHIHEPGTPSLGLLAMWARLGPTVGTFHTSNESSKLMVLGTPWIKPGMEELDARIAVSASAARTLSDHLGVHHTHIIPNGVDTSTFVSALPIKRWQGTPEQPTIGILGRMDESRKGLDEFLATVPLVRKEIPGVRYLVAGRYSERTVNKIKAAGAESIGELDELQKERFMSSVDIYCTPNTGGESFGIVLVEAMAAGAAVVSSDLVAFQDVATDEKGRPCVAFHPVGDAAEMSSRIIELLSDSKKRQELAKLGRERALTFDWSIVAPRVIETYKDAIKMDAEFNSRRRGGNSALGKGKKRK